MQRGLLWPSPHVKPDLNAAEVNWAHPLARDLSFLFLLNEEGGVQLHGGRQRYTGSTFSATWTPNRTGRRGLNFGGTGYVQVTGTSETKLSVFSKLAVIVVADLGGHRTISNTNDGVGTTGGCQWRIDSSAAGSNQNLIKSNVASIGESTTGLSTNTVYMVGVSYDASGNVAFYLNGKADGTGTSAQTFTHGNFQLGHNSTQFSNDEYFNGDIAYYGEWSVVKGAEWFAWMYAEPYAVLHPVVRRRWFVAPAAAAAAATTPVPRRTLMGVGR